MMETVCAHGDNGCVVNLLGAALHGLHLYCVALAAALYRCCAPLHPSRFDKPCKWRSQTVRGVAGFILGLTWCSGAALAALRPGARVEIARAVLALAGWLAATWLHWALWTRRRYAPLLYLILYWLLVAVASCASIFQRIGSGVNRLHVDVYLHTASLVLSLILTMVDLLCFYDSMMTSRIAGDNKTDSNVSYKHNESHFYSKLTFFWLNKLLYKGYKSPIQKEDLGFLPECETSSRHCEKFEKIYFDDMQTSILKDKSGCSLLICYSRMVWPNFYIGGIMKLFGDMMSLVPAVGLAVVVQYIQSPVSVHDIQSPVTFGEFFGNGYVMIFVIASCAACQSLLSQNSTHLVTVEGIRLKTALQGIVFEKCMRLTPWAVTAPDCAEERAPLLNDPGEPHRQPPTGMLTNLVSQDTYNVMSCVWICHYVWAIPLKVIVILYLLYNKLGVSALIGCATSILLITPLQFYIGKKISDNSKDISSTSDHRISKMTEILQGINVIKLYVWEDLFNEKILNLREVELKLLKKDSIYWSFLTFTTQVSTVLITLITYLVYCFVEDAEHLTAVNVFAGLALFNQLSIPLLVLPVTVLMVVQAAVSTARIKEFLLLPESNNIKENVQCECENNNAGTIKNHLFGNTQASDSSDSDAEREGDQRTNRQDASAHTQKILVQYKDAMFSWVTKDISGIEIDDLEIPSGKLIMVVGATGAGKSSLLSAIVGEMYLDRGDVNWTGSSSTWYAGQPAWLLEGSVHDNIVMGGAWCPRRYAKVLRATGLRPDLQLLPEGDSTRLGARGAPLSGGQRVRVCVARALYSRAKLLALDEPLGALDATLARHIVARGLIPATRAGRTVVLATNRLELLHYADMVIVMEDCRVSCWGKVSSDATGALSRWWRLANEARAAAARGGTGPPGGTARERSTLVRALSKAKIQRLLLDETTVCVREAAGAHLLAEVPARAGGSWRRVPTPTRPTLERHLSSPPVHRIRHSRCDQEVRRTMSADATSTVLRREASILRRLLPTRPHRTLARWTPKPLRRLLSTESEGADNEQPSNGKADAVLEANVEAPDTNGVEATFKKEEEFIHEELNSSDDESSDHKAWCDYARACGWWGVAHLCAALTAQALAVAADCWLAAATARHTNEAVDADQIWRNVSAYAWWSACGAAASGCAQATCACAGAVARRKLHERLLHATLYATLRHHDVTPRGAALHRFSADIHVIDRKLTTAVSRWLQLALVCGAAVVVNAGVAPWTLVAAAPAFLAYLALQSVYRRNAKELQRLEASSAAPCVTLAGEVRAGAATVRAGRLQARMRAAYRAHLDHNHNVLLLLNATNRWLGLTLDLVGAGAVCVSLLCATLGARDGVGAGLAGAYSLLLPAYLAHLAKCRADLDLHLSAVGRVTADTRAPQEDCREKCKVPPDWPKNGEIVFEDVVVQHGPEGPPALTDITLTVGSGEKMAICGRSGSGKSTLVACCVGAAELTHGVVRVGGADARQVPLHALRHRVVVAPQEGALFSSTLRENLDPLAVHTDYEIWQCLKVAGLQEFVAAHPAGLECVVNAGRGGWSAGRASRAAVARAVLRAPHAAALLLDEPGAALDAAAERALLAAIAAAAPHITIITVAHRVSSVRNYDNVVVLERGRVAERGPPSTLLADPRSRLARMLAVMQPC